MTRTMFSLARAGFIPRALGNVTEHGTPLAGLLVSAPAWALLYWFRRCGRSRLTSGSSAWHSSVRCSCG
jgi:amino acid permease